MYHRKYSSAAYRKEGYILITGASSGIGREFAIRLAQEGYSLILVARRRERLERLARQLSLHYGHDYVVIAADLSDTDACYELYREIEQYPLLMLINNAGFGDCSHFMEGDTDKEMAMVDVNVKAMHVLMKLAMHKFMRQHKENRKQQSLGHMNYLGCFLRKIRITVCGEAKDDKYQDCILNVASSAGLLPAGPYMATYYATKSYIASLTQAVAEELRERHSSIYVGCLCPGPVNTEFNQVANVRFTLPGISAAQCVKAALDGVCRRKIIIIPEISVKLAVFSARLFPRCVMTALTARQQRRKLYSNCSKQQGRKLYDNDLKQQRL